MFWLEDDGFAYYCPTPAVSEHAASMFRVSNVAIVLKNLHERKLPKMDKQIRGNSGIFEIMVLMEK
jgi:hypothetical protein